MISCDISEFQPFVNDTYPHRWLILRACDGSYLDHKVQWNLGWAVRARTAGRLDGFSVYVVYRPGMNTAIMAHLDQLAVPRDCVLMVDAETWGGQISGNQDAGLNDLANRLKTRQGGHPERVWGYGNRSDLASMWPGRPSWMKVVVASYGGSKPVVPGMIGWQYTDGQYSVPGKPSASAPFGSCDHNEIYLPVPPPPPPEVDMQFTDTFTNPVTGTKISVLTLFQALCRVQQVTQHIEAIELAEKVEVDAIKGKLGA